jgi:hypothetical protein
MEEEYQKKRKERRRKGLISDLKSQISGLTAALRDNACEAAFQRPFALKLYFL